MTKEEFHGLGEIPVGTRFYVRGRDGRKNHIGRMQSRFKEGLVLRFDLLRSNANRWTTMIDQGWYPCEVLELVKENADAERKIDG